jgi:hypothetical protein
MAAKTFRGIVRNQTIVLTDGSPEISEGTEVLITRTADASTNLGRYAFCSIMGMIVGVVVGGVAVALLVAFGQILTPWSPGVGGASDNLPAGSGSSVTTKPIDTGPRLDEIVASTTWSSKRMPLGDTGFVASVGPTFHDENLQKPAYYSIEVQKARGSAWHVYFERDLRFDELPKGFLNKPIAEIVSYDATARKVSFTIGARRFEYQLPE